MKIGNKKYIGLLAICFTCFFILVSCANENIPPIHADLKNKVDATFDKIIQLYEDVNVEKKIDEVESLNEELEKMGRENETVKQYYRWMVTNAYYKKRPIAVNVLMGIGDT